MEEEKERLWASFYEEVKELDGRRRTEIANLREDSMIAFCLRDGRVKVKRAVERWLEAQNFKHYKWLRFFLLLHLEDGVELQREAILKHLRMAGEYEALEDLLDSETGELWQEVERLCQVLGVCAVNR